MSYFVKSLSNYRKISITILLIILSSYIATKTLLNSQNTLLKNPFWTPYRAKSLGLLNGGAESLLSRQPVADGKLRTGHQKVFSKEVIQPESISFQFRLNEIESFVDVLFNGDEKSYEGIRIGNAQWSTLFHYKATYAGKYLWRKELRLSPALTVAHKATLKKEKNQLTLILNDQKYPIESTIHAGKIGFDLSDRATIWAPVVTTTSGTIEAPFEAPEKTTKIFSINLIFISCLVLVLGVWIKPISWIVFFSLITFFCFDNYLYSKQGFVFDTINNTFTEVNPNPYFSYEQFRFNFFRKWYRLVSGYSDQPEWKIIEKAREVKNMKVRYCVSGICSSVSTKDIPPKKSGAKRVMVWGGSMSFGTGLETQDDTYTEVMHRKLEKSFKGRFVIETVNASRMLSTFAQRQGHLYDDIANFNPDVLLVDAFLWNDNVTDYENTLRHVQGLVPKIILIRVPFNADKNNFLSRHEHLELLRAGLQDPPNPKSAFLMFDGKMLRWVNEMNLIFIDPNLHLLSDEVYMNGQLFWDAIHITAYAHEEWGNYIHDQLVPILHSEINR